LYFWCPFENCQIEFKSLQGSCSNDANERLVIAFEEEKVDKQSKDMGE
jgi:hypothetical protein